jgi:hypothetical protein
VSRRGAAGVSQKRWNGSGSRLGLMLNVIDKREGAQRNQKRYLCLVFGVWCLVRDSAGNAVKVRRCGYYEQLRSGVQEIPQVLKCLSAQVLKCYRRASR